MAEPIPTLQNPFAAGRFTPIRTLGEGATGAVHHVHDNELGRDLALKTLLRVSPDEIFRLKQEFRAVAGIVHPNLVRFHELFVEEGQCFFTMDLVLGLHLDEHVRGTAARRRSSGVRASAAAAGTPHLLPDGFNHQRFVDAIREVASGVAALHAAGRVHRDLKPSNVIVTPDGRAVVLDFGFTVPFRPGEVPSSQGDDVAGTLPYMSPEQIWSGIVRPPSDLYSLGVILFELLTGDVPFLGTPEQIFHDKGQPLSEERLSTLDPSHAGLVRALLDPKPERRPDIGHLLTHLGAPSAPAYRIQGDSAPFVGRYEEMTALRAALEDVVSRRQAGVVRVEGASGMGKSELLRRFIASVSTPGEREQGTISRPDGREQGTISAPDGREQGAGSLPVVRAVTGRSRPQESVPYKVFDGALDELSQELIGLRKEQLHDLREAMSPALLRLFPVLLRAHGDPPEGAPSSDVDPREERRSAFVAFRRLLSQLSASCPLLVCLDDAHWGDLDSAALLGSLLTPPLEGPVLFVIAYRAEELSASPFLQALDDHRPTAEARRIRLGALSEEETAALGAELLRGYGRAPSFEDTLVREAAGSPFFVGELARNLAEAGDDTQGAESVDVLGARLGRLTPTELALLEIVAASGRAIGLRTAIDAANCPGATRLDLLRLADLRWLRHTDLGRSPAVETYHDRLRERVLSRLASAPDKLRDTHRRIAVTLDGEGADPEILLYHYDAAGETESAGRAALSAAERANHTLAFERAAELYLRAAELRVKEQPVFRLHELRAEALTNAGRALDAARSFEESARLTGEPPLGATRLDLLRRAGEHYLRTAHYEEGLAIMDKVLRAAGAELPRSHSKALLPAVVKRVQFLFRGHRFESRAPHEVPAATRTRLEALWSAAISLALLDHQRADPIALTHLLEALDRGDPAQALRALAYEASLLASIDNGFLRRRSAEIRAFVTKMAEERGIPYERAWALLAEGSSAWFLGEWRSCVARCDEGAAIFRERCRGVSWEIASMEMFSLSALGIIGDIDELSLRLPLAIRAAEERGDLFALNNCRLGQPSILWLATGRVSELRRLADRADRSMWKGGYHSHRYHHAFAVGQADLHDDDPWSCLSRLEENWPGMKEARILSLEWPHVELRHLRARASLLALRHLRDGRSAPRSHAHLRPRSLARFVEAERKAIAGHEMKPAQALAATLSLSLAAVSGETNLGPLRRAAADACRAADMTLLARLSASPEEGTAGLRRALGLLDMASR